MKRLTLIFAMLFIATALPAQSIFNGDVTIKDFSFDRHGDYMYLNMNIDLSSLDVHNNRATVLSPFVVNGDRAVDLRSIGVYGRRRYITYVRNDWSTLGNEGDMIIKERDCPDVLGYQVSIPYEDWMDGSQVVFSNRTYGCCNKVLDERFAELGFYNHYVYAPEFVYVRPRAEVEKVRSLSGSAYVDFVVSQTVIRPGQWVRRLSALPTKMKHLPRWLTPNSLRPVLWPDRVRDSPLRTTKTGTSCSRFLWIDTFCYSGANFMPICPPRSTLIARTNGR